MTPETGTMSAFLTMATSFLTSILAMVSSIVTTITGSDYLMVGLVIIIVSFALGLLVRIVSKLGHSAR